MGGLTGQLDKICPGAKESRKLQGANSASPVTAAGVLAMSSDQQGRAFSTALAELPHSRCKSCSEAAERLQNLFRELGLGNTTTEVLSGESRKDCLLADRREAACGFPHPFI